MGLGEQARGQEVVSWLSSPVSSSRSVAASSEEPLVLCSPAHTLAEFTSFLERKLLRDWSPGASFLSVPRDGPGKK